MGEHSEDWISGKFILSILEEFGEHIDWIWEIFKRNHIPVIEKNKNYSIPFCLQLIDLLKEHSGPNTIFKLGYETAKIYKIPMEYNQFKTPHEIFPFFNLAYTLNVQSDSNPNYYHYEVINTKTGLFRSHTPFHCEFEKGFIYGILNLYFAIDYQNHSIEHSPQLACRNFGNLYCNYLISWN